MIQSTSPEIIRYRTLTPLVRSLVVIFSCAGIISAVVYLFHIGVSFWGGFMVGTAYLHLILSFFLPLVFYIFPLPPVIKKKLVGLIYL